MLRRALWLSRLARPDLSFIVTRLASRISKWTKFEDRQLFRLMSYLRHSAHLTLQETVSKTETNCSLEVYTDADFAACPHSAKSTSGIIIMIRTGACLYPVHWMSKEQTSIARSTTEAELIALATAMFSQVENLQAVLETILGIDVPVLYQQDNSTLLAVLKTGYSAKLRHANRVHRVNIASVCEGLAEPRASIASCKTDEQRSNGFTKIVSPQEWPATLEQMGILPNLATASASAAAAQPVDVASSQPDVEGHLPNDGAVRGPSHSEVHCFTVGAYCHGGGIVGVRSNTHRFGKVSSDSSVLARVVQHRFRSHQFAAIGLFQGQCTSLHSDAWNEPESYNLVIPLTRVTGGGIWIEDPEGTAQCPNLDCNLPGKILELPQASSLQRSTALFHGPSS